MSNLPSKSVSHETCVQCGEWVRVGDSPDGWVPVEDLRASEADVKRLRASVRDAHRIVTSGKCICVVCSGFETGVKSDG